MEESTPDIPAITKSDAPLTQPLLTDAERLLKKWHLTQKNLDLAEIQLEDLARAVSPSFLGLCLHFLVKVSLARTLMRWPFMQKSRIKLNKGKPAETQGTHLVDRKNDILWIANLLEDEVDLDISDSISVTEENDISSAVDINNDDGEMPLKAVKKRKICSEYVLTNSGLLFECEDTLKRVSAVNAFYDTTDTFLHGVWNAFLTSLIINGLINYIRYPNEREDNDILDAFGITGLRNFFCIRSVDAIKKSFLCSENQIKNYSDLLSSSLGSPYIWPFIAGIPLLFGTINGVRAWRNIKALDKQDVKKLISQLKVYQPGIWADSLGWLFAAAIPDLFPPLAILFMLPQPAIKQALEKIKQTIVWDGRLSATDRQKLFHHLTRFAQQRSQFTQLKAMSMLAEIAEGVHFKHLSLLKKEGVDDETLKALITIKAKALKELKYLAKHYNLPDAPIKSSVRPLFRYLYANYLLWNLGYPEQGFLQPLFFILKGIKLYYTLIFFKAIVGGVIEIINNYLDKRTCLKKGLEWSYFEGLGFNCTVCGDLDIFYNSIFTVSDCVGEYLKGNRTLEDLMKNIVNRSQEENEWGFNRAFDLSQVTSLELSDYKYFRLQNNEWAVFLSALKPKMTNLQEFIVENRFNVIEPKIFGDFIQYSPINMLSIEGYLSSNNDAWVSVVAEILPASEIKKLTLFCGDFVKISSINTFAQALQNSKVNDLTLFSPWIGAEMMKILAAALPYSNINQLSLESAEITDESCQALAEQLPQSYVQGLRLVEPDSLITYNCTDALMKAVMDMKQDFNLTLGGVQATVPSVMGLFAKALSHIPPPSLKKLEFRQPRARDEDWSALFQAIPNSRLVDFGISLADLGRSDNYTALITQFADAIDRSKTNNVELDINYLNTQKLEVLTTLLTNKLRKATRLDLSFDYRETIDPNSIDALFKVLPSTNIEHLALWGNIETRLEIKTLAEILPQTNISSLFLTNINSTVHTVELLAKKLRQTKIKELILRRCSIGDEGVGFLFEGLLGSPVEHLDIRGNDIGVVGAGMIADTLRTVKTHSLWIDYLNTDKQSALARTFASFKNPKTNLIFLSMAENDIKDEGASVLCNVLPQTNIESLELYSNNISQGIIESCGIFSISDTSGAHSLSPIGPYALFFCLYQAIQQSFYTILYKRYKTLMDNVIHSKLAHNDRNYTSTTTESRVSANQPKQTVSMINALHYEGSDTIVVDLNAHEAVAVRGSINSNNVFIGKENSLLDVSQNRRTNFLQSGKNNQLRLGFFSTDHILVTENQGTVQIENFDSKDTLHLITERRVYNNKINATICQNEIIDNYTPTAVIHLQGTTIQLPNTRCEDVQNNIEINNDEVLQAAQREVMESVENHSSILYTNLLGICETFLSSVSQSAMLTAIPAFASEILYRSGCYTRAEIEKFHQELQTLLMVSISNSPHAMAASLLARWLAGHLTNSPQMITSLIIGASIVTSVMTSAVTTNASLAWITLQTGVGLMGSVVGSLSVQKLPDIGRWGFNKIHSATTYYLNNRMSFWQQASANITSHYEDVIGQTVISKNESLNRLM